MLLVDFHEHAQKQAALRQSGSASKADMFMEISIRRTTLTVELNQAMKLDGQASSRASLPPRPSCAT
jgi:hypothetical protein